MSMWKKTDESLIKLARENLEAVGFMDGSIGAFGRRVGESVMELIKVFASQEHTAFTYRLAAALFSRLAEGMPLDDAFCRAQEDRLLRLAERQPFDEDQEKLLWIAKRYNLPSKWMPDLVEGLRKGRKPRAVSYADAPLVRDDDVADDEYASLLDKNDGAAVSSTATADTEEREMNLQQQINKVVSAFCDDLVSFTSIDVSNKVKQNLKVRHREVAHLVRTAFANGDLDQYGYVRDLINVTLKDGSTAQAYLYRHSTVPESDYGSRSQVALSPGQQQQQKQAPTPISMPATAAPTPSLSPRNPAAVPTSKSFGTPPTAQAPASATRVVNTGTTSMTRTQKGDGRLEIPGAWMTRLGWTEGTTVYAVRNAGGSILLTRNPGLGTDVLRKFTVDRWGRIRLTTGALSRVGKNCGTGGQHTLILQADSIKVD